MNGLAFLIFSQCFALFWKQMNSYDLLIDINFIKKYIYFLTLFCLFKITFIYLFRSNYFFEFQPSFHLSLISFCLDHMKKQRSNDSNFILRSFFVHCFVHIYQIITAFDSSQVFRPPRFQLFAHLKQKFLKGQNKLFKNILFTYKWHILRGAVMVFIFVFFNLLMPQLIRMFMHFMHSHNSEKKQVKQASNFIRNLVGVQILRLMFGEHSRRIFHELAIKVQSSLAKKLIEKSLNLSQKAKKDIPYSELLQLENVDLKLVFTMFSNMMLVFQAPVTIFVALVLLFFENKAYGFIGVYWFLIAFLLHRELDQKMTHCNSTKLGLIDKRSKINYEMLFGMRQARMIGWQDTMIEKNNDLFIQQNHDHHLFYFYSSLYDIILLMLPVLVVVTIGIWDLGESHHITVEQVYLMLSLLGICYEPMKSFRTISISFHDGLHSLNRLSQFFGLPEHQVDESFVNNKTTVGKIVIEKDTASSYPGAIFDFFVKTNFEIQINPGERFILIGRKGQGRSAFLNMICGLMHKIQGNIKINGRKATLTESFFFLKSTVKDNICFYNQQVSMKQVDSLCQQLGIYADLKRLQGLDTLMDDINNFSKSLLQRISLARVLCSNANIYILDRPFDYLEDKYQKRIQRLLRSKQEQKRVTVLMAMGDLCFEQLNDKVCIIETGVVQQYGEFEQLLQKKDSKIKNYFKSKDIKQVVMSPDRRNIGSALRKKKFKQAVGKVMTLNKISNQFEKKLLDHTKAQLTHSYMKNSIFRQVTKVTPTDNQSNHSYHSFFNLLSRFVFSVPLLEIIFIMIIIACAQLLHVFIHYFIGHLQEDHGDSGYYKFRKMMFIQVLLTIGLAGVLFYQGQVSSQIAIIQGNQSYKKSLFSLLNKEISYFKTEYPIRIADRFNHDYQEVFIACHGLLNIYKNVIILIVTVIFISSDGFTVFIFFSIVIVLYALIYYVFRKVQKSVTSHFYNFKYGFVHCYQQSLQGGQYLHVFDYKKQLIKRAEKKYTKFASYKLAEKNTNHGLMIACDIMGNLLLGCIVYFGLQAKIHHVRSNIALIATSVHLLLNGSQVLKNILKQSINFETFFRINLIPFLQVIREGDKNEQNESLNWERPNGYEIRFDSIILKEPGQMKPKPLNLKIKEKEHILIFQSNQSFRNLLVYALTKNISSFHREGENKKHEEVGSLRIGNVDVYKIHPDQLFKIVGVVMSNNFYFSGTLRQNLARKIKIDEEEVDEYIKLLRIDQDIEDYDIHGLDSKIYYESSKVNYELTKKFAILRILLYKCKIIILKDTSSFVGSISIPQLLRKYIPHCTIVMINNKIETAFEVQRVIYMDNSVILEQGSPMELVGKPTSIVGNLLKNFNIQDFLFRNKCSRARFTIKNRKYH